jgi:hypothetical protein
VAKSLGYRNLWQNTVQHLTPDVNNPKAGQDKLMQETSENEGQLLPIKIELEMRSASSETKISFISNYLCTARSDLLLHRRQKENIITFHNKETERKDCNSVNETSLLKDEINSL